MSLRNSDEALKLINQSREIAILSPDSPDSDSVSSNLALIYTLTALGKKVFWLSAEKLPPMFDWMVKDRPYLLPPDFGQIKGLDLVIITDAGSLKQFDKLTTGNSWLLDAKTLIIDHHATRDDFEPTVGIIEPEAAATGELLYDLYQKVGWEIAPEIADLMMEGILADTNSFQNLNVDKKVLEVSSKLVAKGANIYNLQQAHIQATAFNEPAFKTLATLMQETVFDGEIVYGLIPYKSVADFGDDFEFTVTLGERIRYLKGVKVSFVLAEKEDGSLRLSIRSQPGIDVSRVAASFGGGGHKVAAGAKISGKDLSEAAKLVVAEIKKQL